MILGDSSKTIIYVNIGEKYFPTTDIKWINKSTGEERRCENFDNYVKAQETIKNERK